MARKNIKLDRPGIVRAAFAVLDETGLEGLRLHLVAARLGVKAPALYWHVRNKAELIGLMAATLSIRAARARQAATGWRSKLETYGRTLRRTMLRHRDAARLCVIAPPIASPDVVADRLARPLVAAGMDRGSALSCQAAVIAYTVGWVAYEQNHRMHEYLAKMIDFPRSFDQGLRALVRGFPAKSR